VSAIEVEHLTKRFGDLIAVRDVSFDIPAGQVVAVLGPNGAGKTTLIEILEGFQAPDGGRARVLGADPRAGGRAGQAWRARIGLVLQSTSLDRQLTVGEAVRLYGSLFERPVPAGEVLDLIGLTRETGTRIGALSGGQARRVDLGLAVIGRPEVLFLDEPTTGLDPRSRAVMWDIIRELAAEGTTLLLTTQYLEEADQLAERVAVIDTGTVIAQGTPDELKEAVGGERVEITLIPGADLDKAAAALTVYTAGPVRADVVARRLDAPITASGSGITTRIVRALDDVGIEVDRIGVRRPSLDDVFLNLTGHQAESKPSDPQNAPEDSVDGEAA
jgi:ABC-2 type transport system ATP-binding protein